MNQLNRWLSLGLVLTLGFLLGMLGFSLWDKMPSTVERVAWSPDAQWIVPGEPSYRFYARRTFYMADTVQAASLRLTADNNFTLYVNGNEIAHQNSTLTSSHGLANDNSEPFQNLNDSVGYRSKNIGNFLIANARHWKLAVYIDLTEYLRPGKNVIALEVQKGRTNPRLVVQGTIYPVPGAPPINLTTGSTPWQVSTTSETRQGLPWFDTDFPDQSWPEAKTIGPIQEATYSRLSQHLFDHLLQGSWITGTESPQGEVWLRGDWQVPKKRHRAFMRLSGNGEYALLINGLLVRHFGVNDSNYLNMYEVTNFLHTGLNTLAVRLARPLDSDWSSVLNGSLTSQGPLGFFLDGWIETDQGDVMAQVATDSTWSEGSTQEQPATILKTPNPQGFHRQFQGNAYLLNYPNYLLHNSLWQLGGISCASVFAWGLGRFWLNRRNGWWDSFGAGAGLLLPGTLFLIGIGLLKHRYAQAERGLLFVQAQSIPLVFLGFVGIVVMTLLWSQMSRRSSGLDAFLRWGLWFLLGLTAWVSGGLATEGIAFFSWSSILLGLPAFAGIVGLTLLENREHWHPRDWFRAALQAWPSWGQWFLLVLIVGIGFALRAYNLDSIAFDSDENTSLDATRGILRTGAPVARSGIWYTRGPFYHYILALWLRLTGDSAINARFLSVLLGTATLILVFIFTREVTGKVWLALVVTAILAIDPWELWFSRNIRFYQLLQFLSICSFLLFFKGFINRQGRSYQYAFFIILTLILLTQEVSITLLPCFVLGFLYFYRPFRLSVDWPVLVCILMTLSIYFYDGIFFAYKCMTPWVALTFTTQTQLKFSVIDITKFVSAFFFWVDRMYVLYTFFFCLGFVYFLKRRDERIVFWFSFVFLTLIVLTVLVVEFGNRYTYPIYPLFILLSVYSAKCVMESLGRKLETILEGLLPLKNIALGLVALLLISNIEPDRVLDGYQDAFSRRNPQVFAYIREHRQAGDVVLANLPAASAIGLGGLDYYLPPRGSLGFDGVYLHEGRLIDRWAGGVAITNLDQMNNILAKANRVWIQLDDRKRSKDSEIGQLYDYFSTLGQPVLETFGVRLRLWQRKDGVLPRVPNQGQDLGIY